jgi:polyhydroxyalkanoate synthase subunit PhaC
MPSSIWRTERQARFAASNMLDALAPTNFPWSNPAVLKESIDAGGANFIRGGRRFLDDVTRSPHLPASVDVSKFEVGGNHAITPGSVVLRTDVFELIQYRPATEQVYEVQRLFMPPTINKYYILDIAPGRSMAEWLVGQQQQVFAISWRNPDAARGHFDLDTYARAVLEARDVVAEITRQSAVNVNAACSGGIITAADRVRLTSIYSKGDGVVHWQCQVIPHADCAEVTGRHVGLIFNRKVYQAVASALALPELSTTTIRCQS